MSRPIPQKRLIIEVGDKKNARKSIIGGRLQLPMLSTAAPFFKCPFFQNSSQGLLHALSEEVVTLRHNSGESIIESHGKGSDCLFRVMEGTVAFVVGDKVIGTAENIWFGENSVRRYIFFERYLSYSQILASLVDCSCPAAKSIISYQ